MREALRLWHTVVAADVAAWVQAGSALAGVVAGGVGYVLRRIRHILKRIDTLEGMLSDVLEELRVAREQKRFDRKWYYDRDRPGQ